MQGTPTIGTSFYGGTSSFDGETGMAGNNAALWCERQSGTAGSAQLKPFTFDSFHFNPENATMAIPVTNVRQRRLVQVFIADPSPDVPVEKAMLYRGEMTFTDSTDSELYFSIAADVNTALSLHNEMRTKLINKRVTDRTEYLEAARIGDLRMQILTIASF